MRWKNFPIWTLFNWNVFDVCKAFNLIWYLANSVWHKPGNICAQRKMAREKARKKHAHIGRFGEEVYWCQHFRCVHANWRRLYTQFSNEIFPFSRPKQTRWISLDERKPSHRFWRTHPHQNKNQCRCFFSCVVAKQIQNEIQTSQKTLQKLCCCCCLHRFFSILLFALLRWLCTYMDWFFLLLRFFILLLHVRLPSLRFICVHILNH